MRRCAAEPDLFEVRDRPRWRDERRIPCATDEERHRRVRPDLAFRIKRREMSGQGQRPAEIGRDAHDRNHLLIEQYVALFDMGDATNHFGAHLKAAKWQGSPTGLGQLEETAMLKAVGELLQV